MLKEFTRKTKVQIDIQEESRVFKVRIPEDNLTIGEWFEALNPGPEWLDGAVEVDEEDDNCLNVTFKRYFM